MSVAQVRENLKRLAAVRNVARMKGDEEMAAKADEQLQRLRESLRNSPDMRRASAGYEKLREVQDMGSFGRFAAGVKETAIDTGLAGAQMLARGMQQQPDDPMLPSVGNLDDALANKATERAYDNQTLFNTLGGQMGMGTTYSAPWFMAGGLGNLALGPRMGAMGALGAAEGAATQPVMQGQNFPATKLAQMGVGAGAAALGELPLAASGIASRRAAAGILEGAREDATVLGTTLGALDPEQPATSSARGRGGFEATIEVDASAARPRENDWGSVEAELREQLRAEGIDLTQADSRGLQRVAALQDAGIPLTSAEIEYVASGGRATQRFSAQQTGERMAGTQLQEDLTALKRLRDSSIEDLLRRPEYGGRALEEAGTDLETVLVRNLTERQDAEDAAWARIDSREDMDVFDTGEREQILSRLYQSIRDSRIEVTMGQSGAVGNFIRYLDGQLADPQGYTLGGVSNLRRDINNAYEAAVGESPAATKVMGEVRREYERALDDLLAVSEGAGRDIVPFDPTSVSRSEAISALREAVGASRRLNQLRNGTSRTTDRRNRRSVLSQVLTELNDGVKTPESVMSGLVTGKGDKARQLINEAREVLGDTEADNIAGMVRDAALRRAINAKVVGRGTDINLRTKDGLKALGDAILTALDGQATLFDELLTPSQAYTLRTVAEGLRELQPAQNLANWSNSAGTFTSILNMVRKVPGAGRLADGPLVQATIGGLAEAEAESTARSAIGLPGEAAGNAGGGGGAVFDEKFALRILQLIDDIDTRTAGARGGVAAAGALVTDEDE